MNRILSWALIASMSMMFSFVPAQADGEPFTRSEYNWTVNTNGLADQIVQTGHLTIDVGDWMAYVELALTETQLFELGHNHVITLDAGGSVISQVVYAGRTFSGNAPDIAGSSAGILVTPDGLYGVVESPHKSWSLQPREVSPGVYEQNMVVVTENQAGGGGGTQTIEIVLNPPECQSVHTIVMKAFADANYVAYAGNWADRITSALIHGQGMWKSETCIRTKYWDIVNAGVNFAGGCGGLDAFKGWLTHVDKVNAYPLFSGSDFGQGTAGCVIQASHLDTTPCPCTHDELSIMGVAGKDWYCCVDSYDPDETKHLSIGLNHELTHLAGEGDHPDDSKGFCNWNLMSNGHTYDCTTHWRTAGTQTKVRTFTYPRTTQV
jgi:hypothetical protein